MQIPKGLGVFQAPFLNGWSFWLFEVYPCGWWLGTYVVLVGTQLNTICLTLDNHNHFYSYFSCTGISIAMQRVGLTDVIWNRTWNFQELWESHYRCRSGVPRLRNDPPKKPSPNRSRLSGRLKIGSLRDLPLSYAHVCCAVPRTGNGVVLDYQLDYRRIGECHWSYWSKMYEVKR